MIKIEEAELIIYILLQFFANLDYILMNNIGKKKILVKVHLKGNTS